METTTTPTTTGTQTADEMVEVLDSTGSTGTSIGHNEDRPWGLTQPKETTMKDKATNEGAVSGIGARVMGDRSGVCDG